MILFVLKNQYLSASISSLGAEIRSLQTTGSDHNWIWSGTDPWKRHAPHLFPIVGKLKNDEFSFKEQTYKLPQHGFARDLEFELVEQTDERLRLRLTESAGTLSHYPFAFLLEITYELKGSRLELTYNVQNRSAETLYFNIGWHPAFVLPAQSGDGSLTLESSPPLRNYHLLEQGLLGREAFSLAPTKPLPLQDSMFARDALVFLNSHCESFALKDGEGNGLKLTCQGAPHFGLWTKDLAKFLCLEPWWGHADFIDGTGDLTKKPSIQSLPAWESWQTTLSVEMRPS